MTDVAWRGAGLVIDAHQHFWDPERGHFPWMVGPAAPLRRLHGPQHLAPELRANGVHGSIVVQAQTRLQETQELLALAASTDTVLGVVGWVDLTADTAARDIDTLRAGPHGHLLLGLRHLVHDEPDPRWLLRTDVQHGLAAVAAAGLAFDLLVRPRELPAALEAVARHPDLHFVIDHLAKPDIRNAQLHAWAELLAPWRAQRSHVWCKLSGMTTLADHGHWTAQQFRPYVEQALQVFGAEHCMFGSDWPVCTLAGSYADVCAALRTNLDACDASAWQHVLSGAARAAYRIDAQRIAALQRADLPI